MMHGSFLLWIRLFPNLRLRFWSHSMSFEIHLGSIWGSFGFHFHVIGRPNGAQKRPGTKNGAGRLPGQKKVNFRTLAPPVRNSFWWFSNHVPEISDFFGIWFAVEICLQFSLHSCMSGRLKIMQKQFRVWQNQAFAHSQKLRFQVTLSCYFANDFWLLWLPKSDVKWVLRVSCAGWKIISFKIMRGPGPGHPVKMTCPPLLLQKVLVFLYVAGVASVASGLNLSGSWATRAAG